MHICTIFKSCSFARKTHCLYRPVLIFRYTRYTAESAVAQRTWVFGKPSVTVNLLSAKRAPRAHRMESPDS